MTTARVLVRSNRTETYADAIAAIAEQYPDVNEVQLVCIGEERPQELLPAISRILAQNADLSAYAQATRLHLTEVELKLQPDVLCANCNIIDVTAVSKHEAVEVAAAAMSNQLVRVCTFQWLDKYTDESEFRVGKNRYEYQDLFTRGIVSAVRRSYIAKGKVLPVLWIILIIMTVVFVAAVALPNFTIPEGVISFFSLLIGAAGLYLTSLSMEKPA